MLRTAESVAGRTDGRTRRPHAAIRLLRLRPQDILLTATALILVLLSHIVVRLVSFATWHRWIRRLTRRRVPVELSSASAAANAIGRVSRRIPGTRCLVQAISAMILFWVLGLEPELHIGARIGSQGMEAHAWVVSNGSVRVGRLPDLHTFAPFPLDRRLPL